MTTKSAIIFKLVKHLLIGIGLLYLAFRFWSYYAGNPINEFRLVLDADVTEGYIIKAEEFSEYVETNDGRSGGMAYEYYYKYYFITKDGKRIEDQQNLAVNFRKNFVA